MTKWLNSPTDIIANSSPSIANGADLQFELLLSYGTAVDDTTIVSTSNWASFYVQLKTTTDKDGLDLWAGAGSVSSSAFNPAITFANWTEGTAQQVLVQIPSSANQILTSQDSQPFWMTIYAETTDSPAKVIPVCAFQLLVFNTGLGVVPPSYVSSASYYNKTQSDARYVQIGTDYSGFALIAGTTFTGAVVLASGQMTSATGLYATTKTYVDAGDAATLAACCQLTSTQTVAGAKTFSALLTASAGVAASALTVGTLSGILQATAGVVSGSATTSALLEGSNLYFTQPRVLATVLAGYAAASGTVTAADTLLTAIQKLGYAAANSYTGGTVWNVASQVAMLALSTAKSGDIAYRTDISESFLLQGTYSILANWKQTPYPVVSTLTGGTVTLLASNTSGSMVAVTSDNIPEGVTNLFYTNARALAQASTLLAGSTFSGPLNFSGTSNTGLTVNSLTTTQIGLLSPVNGTVVYDSTLGVLKTCVGGAYVSIQTGASGSAISALLTGFSVTGSLPVTSSDSILVALQKHENVLEGNTNLKFQSSTAPGLIANNVAGTSGLAVSSSTYGAIVYDTAANVLKAYTSAGWVALSQGAFYLPLTAGSSNPLTGALYFGTTMNQVMAGSNTQLNFCTGGSVMFTLDNSANSLKGINSWFDSSASYGYKVNGQNTIYTANSRTVLDFGNTFIMTTASSGGPLVIGYSWSGISVDTSNNLQLPSLLQMGSGASNKTIDQDHYYYDSSGHQILAAQQSAQADPTIAGGWTDGTAYTDFTALKDAFNALVAKMRTHGLIAT